MGFRKYLPACLRYAMVINNHGFHLFLRILVSNITAFIYASLKDISAMFEMARLEILLHLFISIRTGIFFSATPITTNENNIHGPVMERLSFANDWHTYIKARLFRTTHFKVYNDGRSFSSHQQR